MRNLSLKSFRFAKIAVIVMITRRNRPGISFSLVIAKVADIEKYLGEIVLAILF